MVRYCGLKYHTSSFPVLELETKNNIRMLELPGYKIEKQIGKGGMATVYLAVHEGLHRRVAIKVMAQHLSDAFNYGERFLREARIVASLSHQHIVTVHDVNNHNGYNYIAMEYLPGGETLDHKIKNGLSRQDGIAIIKQVAAALGYAHGKSIVHRDIKPENIMFREDGSAVLTDFGIARSTDPDNNKMTSTGMVIGTPNYMSPEQGHGQAIDHRSDIYSLGVVLYEVLTGKVPYTADSTVAVLVKHVTEPVPTLEGELSIYQPALNLMMAKNRDERYQSCAEIVADLESLVTRGRVSQVTQDTYATVIRMPTSRKVAAQNMRSAANQTKTYKWLMPVLAASIGLLMLGGYYFFSQQPQTLHAQQQAAQQVLKQEQSRQQTEMEEKLQQLLTEQQAIKIRAENTAQAREVKERKSWETEIKQAEALAEQARKNSITKPPPSPLVAANERKTTKKDAASTAVYETLLISLSSKNAPESMHKDLMNRFDKGLPKSKYVYPSPCSRIDECLRYASNLRAKRLLLIEIIHSVSDGDMGSVLADIIINVSLLDVMSGRGISDLKNLKGQVISFDSQNIAWDQAVDRLFKNHSEIEQFIKNAHTCTTQNC